MLKIMFTTIIFLC